MKLFAWIFLALLSYVYSVSSFGPICTSDHGKRCVQINRMPTKAAAVLKGGSQCGVMQNSTNTRVIIFSYASTIVS